MVDTEAAIERFMTEVNERVREGLVTIEKVRIVKFATGEGRAG